MVIEKELLTNLGITKAEAWIVEILSDGQPHTQRDLERAKLFCQMVRRRRWKGLRAPQ